MEDHHNGLRAQPQQDKLNTKNFRKLAFKFVDGLGILELVRFTNLAHFSHGKTYHNKGLWKRTAGAEK